ncbi:unnamed protein product [Protopolystoma xenopodis]|uniref:Uncharacterized protein n=1 Tax=Protopolystoma xenopodis TaxID=117903 RepID=A0A3S5AB78_9PLAT|nr:unnamed protein product [Protopolystoma xenopodis]
MLPSLSARRQFKYSGAVETAAAVRFVSDQAVGSSPEVARRPEAFMALAKDAILGPPSEIVYGVVSGLLLLVLLLLVGHILQPDPSSEWLAACRIYLRSVSTVAYDKSTSDNGQSVPPFASATVSNNSNATASLAIAQVAARHHRRVVSQHTRSARLLYVGMLIAYLTVKAAYTFGVTLTTLIILIRYFTREPSTQLSSLPDWSSIGGLGVNLSRQRLLEDPMDVHLHRELARQQEQASAIQAACESGVEALFDQMEEVSLLLGTKREKEKELHTL